ncbi:MAG: EAL domain-containing response regulator [Acidimicrobiales bacterium]|jgi:EAL domain-containing protein (putative c-di-GMP-specific phosphodiesterase class I)/FixJ family two-component response regulator|nr:EAL domain-containing response regulator [Acidimicrobiales bacterium]
MTVPAPVTGAARPGSQVRILIVDDEPTNLTVLRHMLEKAGYANLLTIDDPTVAVERFCSFEPDLVLLDLHMPGLDGFGVMSRLAPLIPPNGFIPIVVLTADITDATRERALALGAHDFLTKPFRYTELLLRLANLLETRALTLQLQRDNALLEARVAAQASHDRADDERRRSASLRIQALLDADEAGTATPAGHQLTMVYQPVVDLEDGRIQGAEALARFGVDADVSPATWFADAAAVGLGTHLELAAIRRAVAGLHMLPPDTFLSVNASAATITSPALGPALAGVPTDRLVVELTEHDFGIDPRTLLEPVQRLRALGSRLAIDDAGAGATNLQQILDLAPDVIKLDRRFLEGLADDAVSRALATALVSFAAETGATLVAEGLATIADVDAVRAIGIRLGQGHVLGEPTTLPFDPAAPGALVHRSHA